MELIEKRRERFAAGEKLSGKEQLAMMLEFASIREGADALAQRLLEKYGSTEVILSQKYRALLKNEGLTEHAALLLSCVFPMLSRSYSSAAEKQQMGQESDVGNYFVYKFLGIREEIAYMLLLDSQSRFIDCVELASGDVSAVTVSHSRAVENIALMGAAKVAIAHNHPSGSPEPSANDREVTATFLGMCEAMGVEFVGHFVVGKNSYTLA